MNNLERYRIEHGLTYAALGNIAGFAKHVTWKHCQAEKIPAESAIKYSYALGISLSFLRPDLCSPTTPTDPPQEIIPDGVPALHVQATAAAAAE